MNKDLEQYKAVIDEIKAVADFDDELELTGYAFKKRIKEILKESKA